MVPSSGIKRDQGSSTEAHLYVYCNLPLDTVWKVQDRQASVCAKKAAYTNRNFDISHVNEFV